MSRYDVAIIGSGAAGSVMAWELAQRGARVIILEKGRRERPESFSHSEFEMMPRLYKHGGLQTTDDNGVVILQGSTVGGSTVVNNAIWKRADLDRVLSDWRKFGALVDREGVESGYDELERLLCVSEVPQDLPGGVANRTTGLVLKACQELGLQGERLKNNRSECIGCGWCNYGCKYSRKTSMLVTLIPWAERKEAVVRDQAKDVRIVIEKQRAVGVEYRVDNRSEKISAEKVVVCAGAIGSSEVLLQSGIRQRGTVGRGLHVLGGLVVNGLMDERLDNFDGIGLTAIVDAAQNNVIETFFSPPGAFSVTMAGWFEQHVNRMRSYANYIQAGVMVGTAPLGVVSMKPNGGTSINLSFSADDLSGLKSGVKTIAKLFLAAGARSIYPGTYQSIEIQDEKDFTEIDKISRADELLLGSAHPQGGNPMNEDPNKGVVGVDFRVHGFPNLYVADASVFPTNIWANCQATVMAMSHYAATFVRTQ